MTQNFQGAHFNCTDPLSIFEYSRHLIGESLHSLLGEAAIECKRKGKGNLGQMVEELFFGYEINSSRSADFEEANVELKCTPLLKSKSGDSYRIKERLVCTMIDYFELVETAFEDSHLLSKCRLMLLLFYLHSSGIPVCDYPFLFRVLWELPEKDLQLIRNDYETIAEKVRRGEAHLLSEGDTIYLGACRKGQKGDKLRAQPNSPIKAHRRAFSLKPAYMRYILSHVAESGKSFYSNYHKPETGVYELANAEELAEQSFENIIINRFKPFLGLDYIEICNRLGIEPYQSKGKYADISGLIASCGRNKRLGKSEEFMKSGIVMKTIRLRKNGMPKEAMSFKNIDYQEVYDNDSWIDSEAYELFTNRFMFVVFKPVENRRIKFVNHRNGDEITEDAYILDRVFFWTMPPSDLATANEFWLDIRKNVMSDSIHLDSFWSIADHRKFHVRPKARIKSDRTPNPNGGTAEKFCYWFNPDYVKQIIDTNSNNV